MRWLAVLLLAAAGGAAGGVCWAMEAPESSMSVATAAA